ncbi:unnamed protein product [Phytophthora fragariaefolia]|uniref:RxLR effector protein n=1 Tax=Phytophthora fragariaefolia TaxID=1490495 RepID=A0A9W6YCU5_9STRA|nr:unnamed protein product [Phytophthora fragariaefolia]
MIRHQALLVSKLVGITSFWVILKLTPYSSTPKPLYSTMRLSNLLVVILASFLVTSEILSTPTYSNQAQISEVVAPGDPNQRFLRRQSRIEEDDFDSEEERLPLSDGQARTILENLKMWDDVKDSLGKLQIHPRFNEYKQEVNKVMKKAKKEARITHE